MIISTVIGGLDKICSQSCFFMKRLKVEALNPLAREFKSMGTMKEELTELQGELAQAHIQVAKIRGCVQNTCAHRACPLHLGSVNEGHIQCTNHHYVKIEYLPYLCCVLTVAFEHLSLVKFLTPSSGLQGYWNHYPIDMEFRPQHIFT
ncbi:hypothetical protein Goklo_005761, partial [Gossypium klotzschianum]|nr:hypothetical protein [Gossypium klotzschianum]